MSEITCRDAVNKALDEEMERDERVFLMGEDITYGIFRGTAGLVDKYGRERVKDTPISESAMIGGALGAAMTGTRPVVEIMYCDFMGVPFEQILNQVAQIRYMFGGQVDIPVVIRTTEGAGINVAAQHSKTIHNIFAHLPGIISVCPATPRDTKGLLKTAIRSNDPVICFENKTLYNLKGEVPDDPDFTIPFGKAKVMRKGDDVTIVATQAMVHKALEAAEQVEASIEVINLRSLKPLDIQTILESVSKTGRLIVADESCVSYGTHAEIAARVAEEGLFYLDAPIKRIGIKDTVIPFSPPLEEEILPGVEAISAAIEEITV